MLGRHTQYIVAGCAAPVLAFAVLTNPSGPSAPTRIVQDTAYYPGPGGDWERRAPSDVGMDGERLQAAIDFALAHEGEEQDRDIATSLPRALAGEPYNEIVGPVRARTGVNGLVIRHGYIVAEWGDTERADMTFSATKSYLSTVVGLAYDAGLIDDVDDPVGRSVQTEHFASEHNARITWNQMLRHTSGWEGTLWDKPDWADRYTGEDRPREEPGTVWRYNDVRVNMLALAALHVWRQPLPRVLKRRIMDPIGASSTWRWHGYRNSWVTIDGLRMQSVSGGGHWGGGMWISSRDHARFGLLCLRRGRWNGEQLLSEAWIDLATTPTELNREFGFMNWLVNADQTLLPSAPASAYYHAGGGLNAVYVDPEHDLVVVIRWIQRDQLDGFIGRVIAAIDAE